MDSLCREMRVSALGDGEVIFEKIRAVEEVGMVERDTVVVHGSLPVRDNIGGIAVLSVAVESAEW
jgi:hypothetical protein